MTGIRSCGGLGIEGIERAEEDAEATEEEEEAEVEIEGFW